jgi:phosphoenolpyruvate carboxylase
MIQSSSSVLERFQDNVGIKFQLYNSLFLSLPFYGVDKTGILLSLFNSMCDEGYAKGDSPAQIVDGFFADKTGVEKIGLLFRFVQYAERQVVLFDALEEAAFSEVNDVRGPGTLKHLETAVEQNGKQAEFLQKLSSFSVRLVLTAHPTQFYPGAVLGIINDLVDAISANNITDINTFLQQLGRTPFFKKQKPTPKDEALSLIWYLENVFYAAIGKIAANLRSAAGDDLNITDLVKMGFWSGGDRDGNPFVTSETTIEVAAALKRSVLRCYYGDVRRMKRRLTFAGVETMLAELDNLLYINTFQSPSATLTKQEILDRLRAIRDTLNLNHNGLFVHLVDDLINKVTIFGLYFASLDIRQESSIHSAVLEHIEEKSELLPDGYTTYSDDEKIDVLLTISNAVNIDDLIDDLAIDTIKTAAAIRAIQEQNGAEGCERYVISQCRSALNVIEVIGILLLAGWKKIDLPIDVVPLFETITDLTNAAAIMHRLYSIPAYRKHLENRQNRQTIMLGFSDGTKDGGYLMANWSIYKAKDDLTKLSREFGIEVVFFDGRGGPPARGGGKTHRFYSSMGNNIADDAIQLTVQGQTVSSNFGTVDAAQFNIEQLLHAGIYNTIFAPKETTLTEREEDLLDRLARHSFDAYDELKNHPHFLDYLSDVSPLPFYAEANIGSRPSKRGSGKLTLNDLRAIPFVGAWSQIKQNVPGFYGLGSAFEKMSGDIDEFATMYRENAFFKALIDNCEMAMHKCFFPLTAFLSEHPVYGEIWRNIYSEYNLCRHYLGIISGTGELMSDLPGERESVRIREKIVLPLVTIQQYAITHLRELENKPENGEMRSVYERLVIRCSFGIINAGRNSA